jgi:hypothetical protein
MKSVLITGANRGIGLEFVRQMMLVSRWQLWTLTNFFNFSEIVFDAHLCRMSFTG